MTANQFKYLCDTTPNGTMLTFSFQGIEVRGKFIGCAKDAVLIETNGRQFVWPRELCDYRKSSYPSPSYS